MSCLTLMFWCSRRGSIISRNTPWNGQELLRANLILAASMSVHYETAYSVTASLFFSLGRAQVSRVTFCPRWIGLGTSGGVSGDGGNERGAIGADIQTAGGSEFGVGFSREKIMIKVRLLQLVLVLLVWTSQGRAQFAHKEHKQIVDAGGKPLLVRATNLGNWMVPEGYMWLFHGGPQSPGEIRALVLELLGPEGSAAFWQKYRENYVTREDIALLHRAGFNAIRVPLHYSLFESDDAEGFKLLDRLMAWSHAEYLYVILDLHAAPGGQTGTNMDDSAGYPWLDQSPQVQKHLIAITRRLATHSPDEPAVLGCDLLS